MFVSSICRNNLIICKEAMPIILSNYVKKDEDGDDLFDFERIVPIGNVPDWYEQRLDKWSTTFSGIELTIEESTIVFSTASYPPLPIIKKLAELHKDIVFRLEYYIIAVAFCGYYTARWGDGEVLVEEKDWKMTDDDYEKLYSL